MNFKFSGKTFFLVFFLFLLTASTVKAAPVILEIQHDQDTGLMVIWGTDFGDPPVIHMGTQLDPLTIVDPVPPAEVHPLCDATPPPPLNPNGTDCVVAEMPTGIIDGDYLVCLESEEIQGCLEGAGSAAPTSLTFEYTGADCNSSNNTQSAFACTESGPLGGDENVTCAHDKVDCSATEDPADTWTITSTNRLNPDIVITVQSGGQTQELTLHTSCSQDLLVGQTFGALTLTGVVLGDGGSSASQRVCYDLTIGAQGDQGPQGKQGDQGPQGKLGDQGPQGKLGDQGPQGKLGDQGPQGKLGDQGPQGKLGDQGPQGKLGDQGPQGKLGDQGPQGKQGDQGPQGPQGKLGPAGADGEDGADSTVPGPQGPQGKLGPQGDPGPAGDPGEGIGGIGSGIMCFSTDQTLGTNGKYMGLGTQSGEHTTVSVISPFNAADDSTVVRFACKVSQGQGAEHGICELYHDAPDGDIKGELITSCTLTPSSSDAKSTVCTNEFSGESFQLNPNDSLSVKIYTTSSGNFTGGSACVALTHGAPDDQPHLP